MYMCWVELSWVFIAVFFPFPFIFIRWIAQYHRRKDVYAIDKQEKTQLRQFVLIALERPVLTKYIQQTGNLYSKFKSTIQQIDVELFEF